MISSDHLALSDKEDLYHRILLIHRHRDHIFVLALASGDLLAFTDLLHTLHQVPVFPGFLKPQFFRRRKHLFFQFFQQLFVISVQKIQHALDLFLILFFGNIALTRCFTLFDMVIQTGTVFADIPRKIPVAGTDMVQLPYQFHRVLDRIRTCIRSEIFCFILFHSPHKQYPRIFLIDRHFQIRIGLIVLEHRIVFWPVFFDQITFKYQCFQLGIRDDILKSRDLLHHLLFLYPEISAALKILPHPVFQADRFSHIDDRIFRIVHDIDARFSRQFLQFFLNIKHSRILPFFLSLSDLCF